MEDPYSLEAMRHAKPALGSFLSEADCLKEAEEARQMPGLRRGFRIYRLNQRIVDADNLFSIEQWQDAAAEVDRKALEGSRCIGALDLSSHTDLTDIVGWFPDAKTLIGNAFIPQATVDQRERDEGADAHYSQWIEDGSVIACQGHTVEYLDVVQKMVEWEGLYNVEEWRFDRWGIAKVESAIEALAGQGHPTPKAPIYPIGQGFKDLSPGVDELERMLAAGELKHENSPILNYCVSNCGYLIDKQATKPLRKPWKIHPNRRIDLAMCNPSMRIWGPENQEQNQKGSCKLFSQPLTSGNGDGCGESSTLAARPLASVEKRERGMW